VYQPDYILTQEYGQDNGHDRQSDGPESDSKHQHDVSEKSIEKDIHNVAVASLAMQRPHEWEIHTLYFFEQVWNFDPHMSRRTK